MRAVLLIISRILPLSNSGPYHSKVLRTYRPFTYSHLREDELASRIYEGSLSIQSRVASVLVTRWNPRIGKVALFQRPGDDLVWKTCIHLHCDSVSMSKHFDETGW